MTDRPDPDAGDAFPPAYRVAKLFTKPVLKGFKVRAAGAERLDAPGGFILVSNHASWLDPVVQGALAPRAIHFLGHSGLMGNRLVAKILREQARVIAVDRHHGGNAAALELAVDLLREGRIVGVYPEGHRTRDGGLLPFRTGAARLALAAGAPVLPMAHTSYWMWPRHAPVPELAKPLGVAFGDLLRFDAFHGQHDDRDIVRKVTDEIRAAIEGLMVEAHRLREAPTP